MAKEKLMINISWLMMIAFCVCVLVFVFVWISINIAPKTETKVKPLHSGNPLRRWQRVTFHTNHCRRYYYKDIPRRYYYKARNLNRNFNKYSMIYLNFVQKYKPSFPMSKYIGNRLFHDDIYLFTHATCCSCCSWYNMFCVY